jgi:ubiquinone/menaquinone biosynthesis C-methylase UbiE
MDEKRPDIIAYYKMQAATNGMAATVTMPDEFVVEAEVNAILAFLRNAAPRADMKNLLEIGCGNGYLAAQIHAEFGDRFLYRGIDLTPEMIQLAASRALPFKFVEGSILQLPWETDTVDLVISDRVIINVLDVEQQRKAFSELARVMRKGALALLIEGFKEGLANLNHARADFLLSAIPEPAVNNWFTAERWQTFLDVGFKELTGAECEGLAPSNFLSTHYFMSRFVHDALKPPGGAVRNTEFTKFFAQALPPVGDYSPLRIRYLQRT